MENQNMRGPSVLAWLDRLAQDVRYAGRALAANPAFTAAAVFSLALGIGASTAVFSIVDTVFLRPLPYPHSDRLAWVSIEFPSFKAEFLPSPDYVAWRRDNRVFQQLGATQAHSGNSMILSGVDPVEVHGWGVSANFLETLSIAPALGRGFTAQEELPNGPRAIILANAFWRSHFKARLSIVGESVVLDGQTYTVAGVLPASFVFPFDGKLDLLTTLPVSPTASHHDRAMMAWAAIGRLKPGVTLPQAQSDIAALFAASKADEPRLFGSDARPVVESLQQYRAGDARLLLFVLAGAVFCLLLIACANVANLLLARWSARARELAVRAALGASRGRLVRQLLTEIALLTALGCALAMVIVAAMLRGFVHFAASEIPRLSEIAVDARVFSIALAVTVLTALLFGVLPALRAGRVDVQTALQRSARPGVSGGYRLLRRALVASEVALSFMLLAGAGLLLETLWHLENDHLGFQPEHLLTITVPLRGTKYEKRNHDLFAADLLNYIQRTPGTVAVALSDCLPPAGLYMLATFTRADRPLPEPFHRGNNVAVCGAGPDILKAGGTPLLQGRSFSSADFEHPGLAALLNQAAVRAYFPGEDPLGKQIGRDDFGRWRTVIGVFGDAKNQGLDRPVMPQMLVDDLDLQNKSSVTMIVRSMADSGAFSAAIRGYLRSLDPGIYAKFEPVNEDIAQLTAGPRFNSILLSSFASIAFLMALLGVYGVLAFAVAQRTQEIGIRMALGAEPRQVLALVMREEHCFSLLG